MPEATSGGAKRRRIDVHQHIYPPRFTKRMIEELVADFAGLSPPHVSRLVA